LINSLNKRPDLTKKKAPVISKELEDTIAEYNYLSHRLVEIRDPMYKLKLSEEKERIREQVVRAKRAMNRLRRMTSEDQKDIHAIEEGKKNPEILKEANDKLLEISRMKKKLQRLQIKNRAFSTEREVKEERERELEEQYKNLQDINMYYFGGQILENTDIKITQKADFEVEEYNKTNSVEDTRKKYYKDQLKRDIESLVVQNKQYRENLERLDDMIKDQRKMMYEMIEEANIGKNARVKAVLEKNDWMAEELDEGIERVSEPGYNAIGTVVMTEITERDEENLESGQLNFGRYSLAPSSGCYNKDLSAEIRRLEERYVKGEEVLLKDRVLEASTNSFRDMKASNAESSTSSKNRILIRKVDLKTDRKREVEEKKKAVETTKESPKNEEANDDIKPDVEPEKSVVVLNTEKKVSEVIEVKTSQVQVLPEVKEDDLKVVSVKSSVVKNKSELKEVKEEEPVPVQEVKEEVIEAQKEKTTETVVSLKMIHGASQEAESERSTVSVAAKLKTDTTIEERIEVEESAPAQSIAQSGMHKLDETIKSYLLSATFTKPVFMKTKDFLARFEDQEEAVSAAVEEPVQEDVAKTVERDTQTETEDIGTQTIPEVPNEEDVNASLKEKEKTSMSKTIKVMIECTVAMGDGEVKKIVEIKEHTSDKAEVKEEEKIVILEKASVETEPAVENVEKVEVVETNKEEDVAEKAEEPQELQKEKTDEVLIVITKAVSEAKEEEKTKEVVDIKAEEVVEAKEEALIIEEKAQEEVAEVKTEEPIKVEEEPKEAEEEIQQATKEKEVEIEASKDEKEEENQEGGMKSDSMVAKSPAESNYQEEFEKETDKHSLSQLETMSAQNIIETPTYNEEVAKKSQEPVSAPVKKGNLDSATVADEPSSFYEEIIVVDAETQTDADLEGYEEFLKSLDADEVPPLVLEAKKSEVPIASEENAAAFGELTRMNRVKRGEKEIGTTTEPILERKIESEGTLTNSEAQKTEEEPSVKEPTTAQIKGTERSATISRIQNRSEKASAASQTPGERLRRRKPQLVSRGIDVNVGFERKEDVPSAFSSSYWGDSVRGNDGESMAGSMLVRPEMNSIGVGTEELMENRGTLMEGLDLERKGKYSVMNVSMVRRTEENV